MAELLFCAPEIIITSLIRYPKIKIKSFQKRVIYTKLRKTVGSNTSRRDVEQGVCLGIH